MNKGEWSGTEWKCGVINKGNDIAINSVGMTQ
jgi:hypothetical protein